MSLDKSGNTSGPISRGCEAQHWCQVPGELLQPGDVPNVPGAVVVRGDGRYRHGFRSMLWPCHELTEKMIFYKWSKLQIVPEKNMANYIIFALGRDYYEQLT